MTHSEFKTFLTEGAFWRRGPDSLELFWDLELTENFTQNKDFYVYINDFYLHNPKPTKNFKHHKSLIKKEFLELLSPYIEAGKKEARNFWGCWQEPDQLEAQERFGKIHQALNAGEIKKAVPIVMAQTNTTPSLALRALFLSHLLEAPENLFCHGYWAQDFGLIGATPELLFKQEGLSLKTMALAGTCPKTDLNERLNLLEDPKERAEHDFVVQDICFKLKAHGEAHLYKTEILELPTLLHLKTDLEFKLNHPTPPEELIKCLHPTAALGVLPSEKLSDYQSLLAGPYERRSFGAPIGFKIGDKFTCFVAIRNLQWFNQKSFIGSGCGYLSQSEFAREWQELRQKRSAVFKLFKGEA